MRVLERRLRRIQVGLLPPVETETPRRFYEVVLGIRRRRAERLGLPAPDEVTYVPEPGWRGMSLAEAIRASRERWRLRREAEEAGGALTSAADTGRRARV